MEGRRGRSNGFPGRGSRFHRLAARSPERGVALVLVAMIAFALLGIMAINIDLGMVSMTQTQMQTAVDVAAIEGLRMRDASRDDPYFERDLQRRLLASRAAAMVFDTDFVDDTGAIGDPPGTLGAGPVVEMDGKIIRDRGEGAVGPVGSRSIVQNTIRELGNYRPHLQLNPENLRHGDLVQGTYVGDEDPRLLPKEGKRYFRSDFEPTPPIPGGPREPTSDSFLARMRRTNDFLGLDNIRGVSSAGPPLQLLFGQGGTLSAGDPTREYTYRHHGFTVRATAIAQARPVLTVGPQVIVATPERDKLLLGRAPFVLKGKFVKQMNGNAKVWVGNSKIKTDRNGRKVGWFVPQGLAESVGAKLSERDLARTQPGPVDILGYVPILEKFVGERGFPASESEEDWRVIGFGLFSLRGELVRTEGGGLGVGGKRLRLRQVTGQVIAPENASAVFPPTFFEPASPGGTLGAKAVELLLQRNAKLARNGLGIWAPALAE